MIKYIYTFFVGLFTAIFIGMGIAVFYPSPESPEPPPYTSSERKELNVSEQEQENVFILRSRQYDKDMLRYNRNASVIILSCAVVVLAVALAFSTKLGLIADGLLLGGIFTLFYGIIRGISTDSNAYRFLVASVGLLTTLALGYIKFIRPRNTTATGG